jgi:hypothetical protein
VILRRDDETAAPVAATAASLQRGQSALATSLREVAGMVRYEIAVPVSIPHRSSATLSILNRRVAGSEVFLFRPDPAVPGSDRHPVRAARFTCPADTTLEPGPIALYARGSYVGDALLSRVHGGDVSLVPFALDGSATVEIEQDTQRVPSAAGQDRPRVLTVEDRRVHSTRLPDPHRPDDPRAHPHPAHRPPRLPDPPAPGRHRAGRRGPADPGGVAPRRGGDAWCGRGAARAANGAAARGCRGRLRALYLGLAALGRRWPSA